MYDEIKAKLDEEIMDQLSVLSDMDVGSDKRKTAVDDLVKLYRLRIEETKNDRDFIEGVNAREREEQFKKEQIEFKDMCETKSVTSALYLDMNENLPDVSEQEKDLERIVKKAREFGVDMDTSGHSGDSELDSMVGEISKGHNYIFIGKVGQFCPIKPGCGGGLLMRETENKKTGEKGYAAAASSKGYRWLESEMVRELGKEESIDLSYYDNMVTEAVKTISQYGDFEWFVSDDPYVPDTPPWQEPSEPWNDRTPYDVR